MIVKYRLELKLESEVVAVN